MLVLVVAIAGAVFYFSSNVDAIVENLIEEQGSAATGTAVEDEPEPEKQDGGKRVVIERFAVGAVEERVRDELGERAGDLLDRLGGGRSSEKDDENPDGQ